MFQNDARHSKKVTCSLQLSRMTLNLSFVSVSFIQCKNHVEVEWSFTDIWFVIGDPTLPLRITANSRCTSQELQNLFMLRYRCLQMILAISFILTTIAKGQPCYCSKVSKVILWLWVKCGNHEILTMRGWRHCSTTCIYSPYSIRRWLSMADTDQNEVFWCWEVRNGTDSPEIRTVIDNSHTWLFLTRGLYWVWNILYQMSRSLEFPRFWYLVFQLL